jgi:hypothetical protein
MRNQALLPEDEMQEPTDDLGTPSRRADETRAEEPVGLHPAEAVHSGSLGENAGLGNNQTPSSSVADNCLSHDLRSTLESVDSLDSTVPITPMLDFVRSSTEPWRMFFTRLTPAKDSVERRKITRASVTIERVCETEQDELWGEMQKLPPRLCNSLILPRNIREYGSTRELVESIVALLRSHTPLAEKDCSLVAYWSIATWFLDFLPFLPSLVITGSALAADRLLRTLGAVCRRPLALADLSSAVLLTLPLNGLKPTLLIRKPQLNKRLAALFDASNQPGYLAGRGKNFTELYFAKCIYVGEDSSHPLVTPNSIHIHVGGKSRRVLLSLPTDSDIQEFQDKLLFYRFVWHDPVAASKFQVPETQFRPEVAAVAQVLGTALVSEPHLRRGIKELLQERDEQSRVDSASSLDGVVLRAVLSYCHLANQQKAFVREIADAANGIYRQEGESLRISSETTGHVLKNLGLYSRRLGNAGRGLILDKATQSQAHRLAYAYDVLPPQPSCGYCHRLQAQQTEELVQEV